MTSSQNQDYCTRFGKPQPRFPYSIGQEIAITSHIPPAPMYGNFYLTPTTSKERAEIHPFDRCLLHPPQPGVTGNTTAVLKLLTNIRAGNGKEAQIFSTRALQVISKDSIFPLSNIDIVAKFYDPLCFDHTKHDDDPFIVTDQCYTREAKAYQELKSLYGTGIPKYYGSYTCKLPMPNGNQRSVRLILMEYIPGSSLNKLQPANFSQAQRKEIFKQIVDIESACYAHDISHRDLYPRNVILSTRPGDKSRLRVVIIDFGRSDSSRWPIWADLELRQQYLSRVPISPLLRWHEKNWSGHQHDFAPWIDWNWQPWLEQNWSDSAVITPQMREMWLPDDLFEPPKPDSYYYV